MNGDGKPDLVVANEISNNISVLLGNGNGTFQAQQTFAAGYEPLAMAVADLNGDGRPDVVVANYFRSTVSVLLGNGNETFQALQTFAASVPNAVAIADVNLDGKPDLVVSQLGNSSVGVLLGNGNGTFGMQRTFATGGNPDSVAVADVNADGRPDVVTANFNGDSISVLLGDVPPTLLSLNRTSPPGPFTSDRTLTYTVTFSEPVTGVNSTDFTLAENGAVAGNPLLVSGSGAVYTVTVSGHPASANQSLY